MIIEIMMPMIGDCYTSFGDDVGSSPTPPNDSGSRAATASCIASCVLPAPGRPHTSAHGNAAAKQLVDALREGRYPRGAAAGGLQQVPRGDAERQRLHQTLPLGMDWLSQ
jgi:hypothetical protein